MKLSTQDIPTSVLESLRNVFPDLDFADVSWSWEVPGKIYEAEFQDFEGKTIEAEIFIQGDFLLYEVGIEIEELPKLVAQAISNQFSDFSIKEITQVFYLNDLCHYEVLVEKNGRQTELHYREDGLFIARGKD